MRTSTQPKIAKLNAGILTVPDLSAAELMARIAKEHNLSLEPWSSNGPRRYMFIEYANYDFYKDLDGNVISGRGKAFEYVTWRPKKRLNAKAVFQHFKELGFYGHSAAFAVWAAMHKPKGFYISMLEEKDRLYMKGESGHPTFSFCDEYCIPTSYIEDGYWELGIHPVEEEWSSQIKYVAFKEVP